MSTYYGYRCQDHQPKINSELWYNNGPDYLRAIYEQFRSGWPVDSFGDPQMMTTLDGGRGLMGPYWFLKNHENCNVVITSENGGIVLMAPMQKVPSQPSAAYDEAIRYDAPRDEVWQVQQPNGMKVSMSVHVDENHNVVMEHQVFAFLMERLLYKRTSINAIPLKKKPVVLRKAT